MKKQGYLARLYDSLGARNKTKGDQNLHDRSNESIGEEKKLGRRAYASMKSMDKTRKEASPASKKAKVMESKRPDKMEAHPWAHHSVAKLKKHMDGIHKLIARKMSKKSSKY
jgi:hypothetical protein